MSTDDTDSYNLPSLVEVLLVRHREKWLRFVLKMLQNHADAEDVLQEAVLRMLTRERHFDTPEQARKYLGRVICNTAIELYHLRRRQRRRFCQLHDHLLPASAREEPEQFWQVSDDAESDSGMLLLLQEGLRRLPVKQYEALQLTVMGSKIVSMRYAGVEHNIPYSTLRHRSVKGLRRLRQFLRRAMRAAPRTLLLA